ncbi:MAG TPA: L,D-transpeptidase family protein [Terrimicrobiaceae bacterium]|nr:L,D-transpeptidase family protein [Terrimicrobiaceae bacterium]
MTRLSILGLILAVMSGPIQAFDSSVTQLAVSVAPSWDSPSGKLQLFERQGGVWRPTSAPFRVLYGKNGLAWGRGVLGASEPGPQKTERDKRAPAGVFKIGTIYTYDPALPEGAKYPFHTITDADAWIDDPTLPHYNQHVVVDLKTPPPWFEKQKMRLNDPPHRWLIEIRHNADPPVPNAGSAIFFHIQRGPNRSSAGCTVMTEASIRQIIKWLRKEKNPYYVLLPRDEYLQRWKAWGLPSPAVAEGLLGP